MKILDRKHLRNFDRAILAGTLVIFVIGLTFLYSATVSNASGFFVWRQFTWMAAALSCLFIVINVGYQKFIDTSFLLYGFNLVLLVAVLFVSPPRFGAHRWLIMGPFTIQPSEFMKLTLILAVSYYLGQRRDFMDNLATCLAPLALLLPCFFLILMEPDLGTAIILIPVVFAMLFVAGANLKFLAGLGCAAFFTIPFFWQFLKDYQKQRLLVFLNPNLDPLGAGYTVIQSKIAIGSGGIFGRGWLSGSQNQLNFLPERHTDFIFSVVGEEWGFFGSLILLSIYAVIIYRGIKIISETRDIYGKTLATGIVALFSLHVIINVGMAMGLMPVVGLTLPLISYGGSNLFVTVISLGLLLNIGMQRPFL